MEQLLALMPFAIEGLLIAAMVVIDFVTRRREHEKIDLERLLSLVDPSTPRPETGTWVNVWVRVADVKTHVETAMDDLIHKHPHAPFKLLADVKELFEKRIEEARVKDAADTGGNEI